MISINHAKINFVLDTLLESEQISSNYKTALMQVKECLSAAETEAVIDERIEGIRDEILEAIEDGMNYGNPADSMLIYSDESTVCSSTYNETVQKWEGLISEQYLDAILNERSSQWHGDECENLKYGSSEKFTMLVLRKLGLWNGDSYSIRISRDSELLNMMYYETNSDTRMLYALNGRIEATEIHHDGTNIIKYMKLADENKLDEMLRQAEEAGCPEKVQEIMKNLFDTDAEGIAESLYPDIAKIYGWDEYPMTAEIRKIIETSSRLGPDEDREFPDFGKNKDLTLYIHKDCDFKPGEDTDKTNIVSISTKQNGVFVDDTNNVYISDLYGQLERIYNYRDFETL